MKPKNKILFLDLDGVVNVEDGPFRTITCYRTYFDPNLIKNLNQVFDSIPDLGFVLTSTWRFDMPDAQKCLEDDGFLYWDRLVGKTGTGGERHRGERILKWLDDNNYKGEYLVIDDRLTGICGEPPNDYIEKDKCLWTNPAPIDFDQAGLTQEKVQYVLDYFNERSINENKPS